MGIFNFLKKKKTEAKTEPQPSRSFQQSSLNHSSSKIVPVTEMIDFGLRWRDIYLDTFALNKNTGTRVEALLFSCWFIWYYCLERDKVSREQSYLNNFFANIMAHLYDDDARFDEVDFFMPLFKNRYSIFKDDFIGLLNSHYPQTKQYLPIRTYKAFCLKPMEIIAPNEASISSLTMEQHDEMNSFVGNLITFITL